MPLLEITADLVFCLGVNVRRADETNSGFVVADTDTGGRLFSNLRLEGFAAAITTGFAKKLVVLGGAERRLQNEGNPPTQAEVIQKILVEDYKLDPGVVESLPSDPSTTEGDVAAIADYLERFKVDDRRCCVLTNDYHGSRSGLYLWQKKVFMWTCMAEAMVALQLLQSQSPGSNQLDVGNHRSLITLLGGGAYATRVVKEATGIAAIIAGTSYRPKRPATN